MIMKRPSEMPVTNPNHGRIERDSLKVVEVLRNSLKDNYFLVITIDTGKIGGRVIEMNSINGRVTIENDSGKIELNMRDILVAE